MKIKPRHASYLLILFSLIGYLLCIPVLQVSAYIKTSSMWLEEIPTQLDQIREMINETSNSLQASRPFFLDLESLLNTASEFGQSLQVMLANETMDQILESANQTIHELTLRLHAVSNLTLPRIANEINVTVKSLTILAENFSRCILCYRTAKQNVASNLGNALEGLDVLEIHAKDMQARIEDWSNYLNQTSSNIDTWISRSKSVADYLRSIEYFFYLLIIYLLGINTALLLTGIYLYQIAGESIDRSIQETGDRAYESLIERAHKLLESSP